MRSIEAKRDRAAAAALADSTSDVPGVTHVFTSAVRRGAGGYDEEKEGRELLRVVPMEYAIVVDERVDSLPVQRSDCVGGWGIPVPVHQYERNKLALVRRVGSKVWLHVMRLAGDHEEYAKPVSDMSKRSHVCT